MREGPDRADAAAGGRGEMDRRQFLASGTLLTLSASGLLTACGSQGADKMKRTVLRVRNQGEVRSLDPALNLGTTDEPAAELVYEGLVHFEPDSERISNVLAETFEPSSDGLRYAFKLKEGIQFHRDYGEVTAEDVKFSYERLAGLTKPKVKGDRLGDWASLQEVRVTGKYEGTIVLQRQDAAFPTATLATTAAAVYSKRAVEKLGEKFGSQPVGTGPYELTKWAPRQEYTFRRFKGYGGANPRVGKAPEWETITLVPIVEDSAALTGLQAGELDFGFVPIESVDRMQRDPKFRVDAQIEYTASWLGMNVLDEHLQDKRLREAIRYAIDVPSIIAAAYSGKWKRAYALVPPELDAGYWKDAPRYERDVEKARALVEQAGASGIGLTFHIYDGPQERNMAQVVQANLKDVGIDVKIIPLDDVEFAKTPGPKRQLSSAWWAGGVDPSVLTQNWTCDQIGNYNLVKWCDKDYSRLWTDAAREQDPTRRRELYVEMQQLLDESVSTLWMGYPTIYYATRKALKPSFRAGNRVLLWNFRSA